MIKFIHFYEEDATGMTRISYPGTSFEVDSNDVRESTCERVQSALNRLGVANCIKCADGKCIVNFNKEYNE